MRKLALPQTMKAMDDYAIHTLGVPSLDLMERAAEEVVRAAKELLSARPGPVVVVCSSGNNGGDGIAAARLLLAEGCSVRCFLVGLREKLTPDAASMAQKLEAAGGVLEPCSPEALEACLPGCALVIDALFGTGLNRPLAGDALAVVELVNQSDAQVVSCDIASGVDGATGAVLGGAIRADVTVTFTMAKPGQLLPPGLEYTGRLRIVDIGIPRQAQEAQQTLGELTDHDFVKTLLPRRRRESHKGDFGKLLLLAGSRGYTGAAALAARGAVRSGAGLVSLGTPEAVYPILAAKLDETMVFPLACDSEGRLSMQALPSVLDRMSACDAVLLGPGLGRSRDLSKLIAGVLEACQVPLVLDADGINGLDGHIDILRGTSCPVVLTPHEGEFARLSDALGRSNRLDAAKELAAQTGAAVVLKGYRTLIAAPDGRVRVNTTGNPGMATGGSGDVLAGVLTSFLGQGLSPFDAASAAAWVHGAAGDLAAAKIGEYGLTPTDLIETVPQLLF